MNPVRILTVLCSIALLPFAASAEPLPADALATLQKNVDVCRTGADSLHANLYRYPAQPTAFKAAFDAFDGAGSKACNDAVSYIIANRTHPSLAAPAAVLDASAGHWVEEILSQGRGVIGYCPQKHSNQFDCIKGGDRIAAGVDGLRKLTAAVPLPGLDTLRQNVATCKTGVDDLKSKMYRAPAQTATFKTAFDAFKGATSKACNDAVTYIFANRNHPSLAAVSAVMDAGAGHWVEEILSQGAGVIANCPRGVNFNCVSAGGRISNGVTGLGKM
ncbi:MAG: hypothetical protein KC620_19650, partial [Myxococcales bacterium]|nr:hypothetical protein [Myxococcales bacterium]